MAIFRFSKYLVSFYLLVMAAMFVFQRDLMYHPTHNTQPPAAYGLEGAESIALQTPDGVPLNAWWLPSAQAEQPLLLHLHGNGGDLGRRADTYAAYRDAGFNVLALDWRGFGNSGGESTEQGLYIDARTALAYAKEVLGFEAGQVILYGESLGTAVAVQMAVEGEYQALVLEAPPLSVWQRAAEIYFWLPVKYLVRDRYDSLAKIQRVDEPLLIIHNTGDKVVPVHHGRDLFAAANQPKRLEIFDGEGHVSFDRPEIAQLIHQLRDGVTQTGE